MREVDEESYVKTCSMNCGEANSVYTNYIVSTASNGKIQDGALIFVLVGYISDGGERGWYGGDDFLRLLKQQGLTLIRAVLFRSTDTLRLLTSEQKTFKENLHKSGVGYNGPFVLSQAYAKIPKLYRASKLCDKNEQMHVFDSEETLEDAEKSQLKMNEFQKDEKVQELKIQPIDYEKLNKLYKDFVPQKELSAEQTYFSSSSIPCDKDSGNKKYAE
ncbi:hypothetical protein Tco_0628828 [Tanacetum coccineum]|uniref:Uncharacterized protein n=1 Tax=Tanacetum coccineum TaxID=301880 RepID=A0ABQ4WRG0_9ASTR